MYVNTFSPIFQSIRNDELREFAVESVNLIQEDSLKPEDIKFITDVIHILNLMCDELDVDDIIRDMFVTVGLLHRFNCEPGDPLSHLKIRGKLIEHQGIIGRELFNDMMLIIEGQAGFQSPIPQVEPRETDPVYNWFLPMAIRITTGLKHYGINISGGAK